MINLYLTFRLTYICYCMFNKDNKSIYLCGLFFYEVMGEYIYILAEFSFYTSEIWFLNYLRCSKCLNSLLLQYIPVLNFCYWNLTFALFTVCPYQPYVLILSVFSFVVFCYFVSFMTLQILFLYGCSVNFQYVASNFLCYTGKN